MDAMPVDTDDAARKRFDRWAAGETGFDIVDAGMRELAATGWMHNRVRMIVASFLVKDLHLPWQWGARWFLEHLIDGDLASNNHGWQWAAGTGTDAAPYFRVFNPHLQQERYDPDGSYVARWVPNPVEPMLDHHAEREEALRRLKSLG
jgi:deoxyribodipyrimidine photo-lyase